MGSSRIIDHLGLCPTIHRSGHECRQGPKALIGPFCAKVWKSRLDAFARPPFLDFDLAFPTQSRILPDSFWTTFWTRNLEKPPKIVKFIVR